MRAVTIRVNIYRKNDFPIAIWHVHWQTKCNCFICTAHHNRIPCLQLVSNDSQHALWILFESFYIGIREIFDLSVAFHVSIRNQIFADGNVV